MFQSYAKLHRESGSSLRGVIDDTGVRSGAAQFRSGPARLHRPGARIPVQDLFLFVFGSLMASSSPSNCAGFLLPALWLPNPAPACERPPRCRSTRLAKRCPRASAGQPKPAVVTDAQLYNTQLDYSHDNDPDFGWFFPTRGYDLRNKPAAFRVTPNSLIYPTDPPYIGADNKTYSYDNFNAPIELIQLGQAAQISTMQISMGVAREMQGSGPPTVNLNAIGAVAVILFWDGVYNDLNNGFPRDDQGSYKLASDGTLARRASLCSSVRGSMTTPSILITMAAERRAASTLPIQKGRMGMTVAAVYDPNAGSFNGQPFSTREDGVYLRPGASVGQNKYYQIQHGNFDIGTPSYDGNGIATTQNTFSFQRQQWRHLRRYDYAECGRRGHVSGGSHRS